MGRRVRLQETKMKMGPGPVDYIKVDPLVWHEAKRIVRPSQKIIIVSSTEVLLVPDS